MPRREPKFKVAIVKSRGAGSVLNCDFQVTYLKKCVEAGGAGVKYKQVAHAPQIVTIPGYRIMGKVTCLIDRAESDEAGCHPYFILWLNEFAILDGN